MSSGDWTQSDPHACEASTSPAEPSSQPCFLDFNSTLLLHCGAILCEMCKPGLMRRYDLGLWEEIILTAQNFLPALLMSHSYKHRVPLFPLAFQYVKRETSVAA